MASELYDPDRDCEPGGAGWRDPRCYTRPARAEVIAASRLHADGNGELLAIGIALTAIWCVAAFLIFQNGWSF